MRKGDTIVTTELRTRMNKISTFGATHYKFAASILGYSFILIGSVLISYFANQRGNPGFLICLYSLSVIVNVVQLLGSIGQVIANRMGYFLTITRRIELILAGVWGVVIVTQFIAASIIFLAFRTDLLLITFLQFGAIYLLIQYSNRIDYLMNRYYMKQLVQQMDDIFSRKLKQKRDRGKLIRYFVTAVLIFAAQVTVLVLPKTPPSIDDIFSPSRTLQYVYSEQDDGYYVSDVYSGLNRTIIIPLTYNHKPVIGILSEAIQDDGIINHLQIGEYNQQGQLVSHVQWIQSNGITLHSIVQIDIPSSIIEMQSEAITGSNIEVINYHSNYPFSMGSFDVPNLRTIHLLSTTHVVNIDFGDTTAFSVNVPLTMYNTYREMNFSHRRMFRSPNTENIIIIDFETGTNQYLDSQLIRLNDGMGILNITALKNEGQETSSFIKDTILYNSNNFQTEGFKTKPGYAFRGWFRDVDWTMECIFNDSTSVLFNTNTTVYAKWV